MLKVYHKDILSFIFPPILVFFLYERQGKGGISEVFKSRDYLYKLQIADNTIKKPQLLV
ncbi:MAG: hypothetical protein ABI851_03470 [Saprospiraceae bacterium]